MEAEAQTADCAEGMARFKDNEVEGITLLEAYDQPMPARVATLVTGRDGGTTPRGVAQRP